MAGMQAHDAQKLLEYLESDKAALSYPEEAPCLSFNSLLKPKRAIERPERLGTELPLVSRLRAQLEASSS